MTRIPPPLLGYNNNVRYLGRTFHIQTEDSGTKYARIMTHLFMDGGRIVKSTRTEYGSVVGQPGMAEAVRRMMKDQHKSMFLALRAGEFDALIERVSAGGVGSLTPEPKTSRAPQLRAESSLPPLSFVSGEEPKTLPGMSTLIIEPPATALNEQRPPLLSGSAHSMQNELRHGESGQAPAEPPKPHGESSQAPAEAAKRHGESGQFPAVIPKRPSGRPTRKAKSSFPPGKRSSSEPIEAKNQTVRDRPSERPSKKLAVRPPTSTQEAIDPRSQSIFGEAAAGKQTLDEVILSFLEDEDS